MLLQLLEIILLTAAAEGAAVDALFLGDGARLLHVVISGAVELFLKDRVGVHGFEFGLEIAEGLGAAVGAAALVREVVAVVLRLLALDAPVRVSR